MLSRRCSGPTRTALTTPKRYFLCLPWSCGSGHSWSKNKLSYGRFRRVATNMAAEVFWRIPGRFGFARIFGRSYSLRCVVFHNISTKQSPFTTGIKVDITPKDFEKALGFLDRTLYARTSRGCFD